MVEAVHNTPFSPIHQGFHDPIAEAQLSYEPTRPRPIEPQMIQWVDDTGDAMVEGTKLVFERLEQGHNAQDRLHSEISSDMKKKQSHQSDETMWGALSDLGALLSSAFSVLTGIGLVATGNPIGIGAGASLIIGGIGSLSSVAMKNAGYDETTVGTIALVATGFSLVGGGVSAYTGIVGAPGNIGTIVTAVLGVMNGAGQIGQALSRSAIENIDGKIIQHRGALDLLDSDTEKLHAEVSMHAKHVQLISKRAARMLEEEAQVKLDIMRGW